jgi:hypothetical protein
MFYVCLSIKAYGEAAVSNWELLGCTWQYSVSGGTMM